MIYEKVKEDASIRQGDIYKDIPIIDFSPSRILASAEGAEELQDTSWQQLIRDVDFEKTSALVTIRRARGIVITQDCDTMRSPYISLARIDLFSEVVAMTMPDEEKIKKYVEALTKKARENLKWFYLPPNDDFGNSERMAADFRVVFQIPRADLMRMGSLRIGRLNEVADEHFRETIAQFFRRYPYNEWYPLSQEEFQVYQDNASEEVTPYPWQVKSKSTS